jgi:hypothetical protein
MQIGAAHTSKGHIWTPWRIRLIFGLIAKPSKKWLPWGSFLRADVSCQLEVCTVRTVLMPKIYYIDMTVQNTALWTSTTCSLRQINRRNSRSGEGPSSHLPRVVPCEDKLIAVLVCKAVSQSLDESKCTCAKNQSQVISPELRSLVTSPIIRALTHCCGWSAFLSLMTI